MKPNQSSAPGEELAWRQAPHNLEAEQALLGAILVNNEAHDRVSSFLEAKHFYDPLHEQIYETLSKLIASGKQATPITLRTFFETAEPIDATTTVPVYLGKLGANATTIVNASDYGRTIRDLAIRRGLILIGEDVVNKAYDTPVDFPPQEQIEEAETRLYSLAEHGTDAKRQVDAPGMLTAAVDAIERAYNNKGKPTGISTHRRDLDAKLGRLQSGDLIVLAARPSMGKTALATNVLRNQTKFVHFFSLEMSAEQIGLRLVAEETGIPGDQLRRGDLDEAQWRLVLAAQDRLSRLPRLIDETGGITIAQLVTRARRIKRRHNTALIIIDYLQLMRGNKRGENRNLEIGEITSALKAMAKELDVPVVVLSQLSREVEKRPDKRPQLADLRDSGSIEQDADIVMFLFREEYYLERLKPDDGNPQKLAEWIQNMQRAEGKAEVIIGKNRHAAIGTVSLQFDASITRFSDVAPTHKGVE